ncbi:YeeE/YedE family protein [Demequina muriae]|uniref:YeeE/YedE family protein n=1 Tax=Demequina muriae TaxID=3051664 RepID=A0ABT8GEF6_9MICO|nr:YeeE/YedE family protein [Demequina sp. EGI L300058]MDN4479804.1 YeeE/YedE family protein [Demequina sp. EGI L300058]
MANTTRGIIDRTMLPLPKVRPSTQVWIGLAVLVAAFAIGLPLADSASQFTLFMITGLALGYILTRSRFGYAGGVKRIWMTGEGSLTKALVITFALASVFAAGIHWAAAEGGAVAASVAAEGDAVIPGTQNVGFIGLGLVVGGLLFGAGMIMAGGCASGTLSDFGEGAVRVVFSLPMFIVGSVIGVWMTFEFEKSSLGTWGTRIYLPDSLGYLGAVALTLAGLLAIYGLTRWYEQRRKSQGLYAVEEWSADEKELPEQPADEPYKFFSARTFHTLIRTRWSFVTGGVLLAFMFLFILVTTKKSWGVTGVFAEWGIWALNLVGIDLTHPAFAKANEAVDAGIINSGVGVRNVGIILGAAVALLLASRFAWNRRFNVRDVSIYMLGGLLMGIGARLAHGCNIGALYSGIGNLSLSGWIFGIALWAGALGALKYFAGKVNIIDRNPYKLPKNFV